jgi:transposase InsO family protein
MVAAYSSVAWTWSPGRAPSGASCRCAAGGPALAGRLGRWRSRRRPPTRVTAGRWCRIWPAAWSRPASTSSGWPTSPMCVCEKSSLISRSCSTRSAGSSVGFLANHLQATLAVAALEMALAARQPVADSLIHHSDRGVQYACHDYTEILAAHRIRPSMSRIGNPYDNAVAESFMKTLKQEEIDRRAYRNIAHASAAIGIFVERVYNAESAFRAGLSTASGIRGRSPCQIPHHGGWPQSWVLKAWGNLRR